MADLTQAYEALRKEDAAGNREEAKKWADYIRAQGSADAEAPPVETAPADMNNSPQLLPSNPREKSLADTSGGMDVIPPPTLQLPEPPGGNTNPLMEVGKGAGFGALAGIAAPELTTGLGMAVSAIPHPRSVSL